MAKLDADEIRRAVALFLPPGLVVELRVPNADRDGTISGYFSDPDKLAKAVASCNGKAPGIYATLNPVLPDLLSRADNRVKPRARTLTVDADITGRRWLLLDFDPVRPAGISSNEAEHDAALDRARRVEAHLMESGWPAPVRADSGNGGHLLYRIDLDNSALSADLIQRCLKAAYQRYATPQVDVDRAVFNASRISKVYGTISQKGDSTADRPHRVSKILSAPEHLQVVSIEQLQDLAAEAKPDQPRTPASGQRTSTGKSFPEFDLERFISTHGIEVTRGPVMHQGSEKWVLAHCPFNPAHLAPDSAIFRQPSGRLGFKCLHASCADKDWAEFRDFFEPSRPRVATQRVIAAPAPLAESDECDKNSAEPAADTEAAVEAAIAANDLVAVMRLAPAMAGLRHVVRAVLIAKVREHFGRRFSKRDFEKAMSDATESTAATTGSSEDPDIPADEPNLLRQPLTDAGNGERIVALFGGDIRYCVEMKRWLVWDGRRWAVDEFGVIRQMAKQMARKLHAQAKGNSSYESHARATESYAAISAAIGSAASEKGIPISASELDQHAYLLNCPNCVVDLRDGKVLPHGREFLITKLCPVPYRPEAECPRFLGFIEWAMGGNPDAEISQRTARLVGFLQRAFGYALTADVSEKAVFILYGKSGNNGKTTLLTVFRDLLGKQYSGQISIDTVMSSKNQDATMRADLADLRGVRFVVTSEVEKEHRLNEGKIKYITAGMGEIKSCRKYENPIEFAATHKLFMDCNHRPRIGGTDDAIWRRLKLIPFMVTISKEEMDEHLKDKLEKEFSGILAWAVRGCMQWLKEGLGEPPEVSAASEEWREHDDPLKEFMEDSCVLGKDEFVSVNDLAAAYELWAKQARERWPLGGREFNERLYGKGLEQGRRRIDGRQARIWTGIGLRSEIQSALHQFAPAKRMADWGADD